MYLSYTLMYLKIISDFDRTISTSEYNNKPSMSSFSKLKFENILLNITLKLIGIINYNSIYFYLFKILIFFLY